MTITYKINEVCSQNILNLDIDEIRYDFINGFFSFDNNLIELKFDWDNFPLYDLSLCLSHILDNFLNLNSNFEEFEFTESEDKISFIKINNQIEIIYKSIKLVSNINDFKSAILHFNKSINNEILRIEENKSIKIITI